jgi:NAD(P)-dependent dehydrogenase (short-subunit alcohol dehydrogenase family)
MMNLQGKVVLITGASGGIGEAAALAFSKEGCRVAVASRRAEKLELIARQMTDSLVIAVDLSDVSAAIKMIDRVVEHYGRIDILINNAASIIVSPAETVATEDLIHAFTVNMAAPAAATQQAIKYMKKNEGGQIINLGSPGFMMGIPFYAPYVCSKAAFSAWTRTIQAEWAGSDIKVSEYFPGYIKTDSKPDSRIGDVEQDFLMEKKPGFLIRTFASPKTPAHVAAHLVKLAKCPRTLMYSDLSTQIGAFISNFPGFRLSLARNMAANARKKLNQTK